MQEQVEEVASKLKESNEALTSRLVKLKPDVDALCGVRPKSNSKKEILMSLLESNKIISRQKIYVKRL